MSSPSPEEHGHPDPAPTPAETAEPTADQLLPTLRWLLTKASGTLGLIAHQLESRAADIDDAERAQLRDDVRVLEDELVTVKALLAELIDWDAEFGLLLEDELPPCDPDPDSGDEN
jgi:hypothetical protein